MPMGKHSIAAGLLGLVLALAACGDDDREGSFTAETGTGTETTGTGTTGTETSTTPSAPASKTFGITEVEFRLEPSSLELAEPGVVQLVVENDGGTVHALEVEGPTGEFETEEIQPGERATLKADVSEAGSYELYCPIGDHKEQGMVGELRVAGATGSAEDNGGEGESGEDESSSDDSGY